MTFSIPLCYLY